MFGKFNKNNNSKVPKANADVNFKNFKDIETLEKTDKKFYDDMQIKKKDLLSLNPHPITREEIYKEINKQFQTRRFTDTNPFKTREDMYYLFYNYNMQLNRQPVPFEEVKIGGKPFYINKKWENNQIVIDMMFASPDVDINLKDEYSKKETTKKQLEKINKEILYIKNKIAEGDEKYKLLDIEDLIEEKLRLERILDGIKYGKSAIFIFQDPITNKKAYMMRYVNGEYKYLKITESNHITEENNVRFIKGYAIQKKLEDITNLRIIKNFREFFIAIFIIILCIMLVFGFYQLTTFDEVLFDKRVQNYCGDLEETYQDRLNYFADLVTNKCNVALDDPAYKQQI